MPGTISLSELKKNATQKRSQMDAQLQAIGYMRLPNGNYVKAPTQNDTDPILSSDEAQRFNVPFGTRQSQVFGREVPSKPLEPTADERNKQIQAKKALGILDQVEKYSNSVNTFGAGPGGVVRLGEGLLKYIGGKAQTNKNATLLMQQSAKLSNLIRALGEVGTLAEGDVQRGIQLLPSVFDTKEIAKQKLADLRELLQGNASVSSAAITGPQKSNNQQADPLGVR